MRKPAHDLLDYRDRGQEIEALFARLREVSAHIHAALDVCDTEAILMAIRDRNATIRRIQPLFQELLEARAKLGGGSRSPVETAEIVGILGRVSRAARQIQDGDGEIARRLSAERRRVAAEIERLEGNAGSG